MKKLSMKTLWAILLMSTVLVLVGCKTDEPTEPTDPTVVPTEPTETDPTVVPTEVTFDVTFDADNGTTPVVVQVLEGQTVTEPTDPTKSGFTFTNWYLGDNVYQFSTPVTANITLTAHYEEILIPQTYTVTFNTVGGTMITSQTVNSGEVAVEPTEPTKEFFVFESWMNDDEEFSFDSPITEDLVLTAKYSFMGIPDSPAYDGRVYNEDFDQLINPFTGDTLSSDIVLNADIDEDQPYISVGYSGEIGNNPNGALWKQAGSQNGTAPVYQYLVIRMRGTHGASIEDLSIGFRLDDNHEVLVVPMVETFDPDLENNVRELDETWHNYVISITDTLDGKSYVGKTGFTDVAASGIMVGFHIMNTSVDGSGILEIKDAYYSKVPNPIYPYEGSDYHQNKDYWSGTVGVVVGTYVTVQPDGFYGEYLEADVNTENTHLVLQLRQATPGVLDYANLSLAPVFEDGSIGTEVLFTDITNLPVSLGSGWLNVTIPFADIYDGELLIAGYKLFNNSDAALSIGQSFLSYLGDYEAVEYPVLNLSEVLIYDNFNRGTIGTTTAWTPDNPVAIDNGFTYLISYSDVQSSTIGDGHITFDSTGGEFVSYKVHSTVKANVNEYRYMVFKYKLNDGATLDNLRMSLLNFNDQSTAVIYANQWVAGLGLPSVPEDQASYPYQDGDWTYLIIDLFLTEGYSTDVAGFEVYYTGSSISFDAIFFANAMSSLNPESELLWATFEGLTLGTAQGQVSDQQWWANVYDSPTTIVADGESNQALRIDGTGYAQYHTGIKGVGRYLSFDLKIETVGELVSFRVGPTGADKWAKDGELILENGTPMVVNTDGNWHHYVIDWVASGFALVDTIGFHASNGEVYLLDNLAWYSEYPYFDEELVWGSFEGLVVGDANGQAGDQQWWANNYGTTSSIVSVEDNLMLKLDATLGYAQYHTGVKAKPRFIAFDIKVETAGSFGINVGGTHKWNNELLGLDGNPIVLPAAGETAHIVIDALLSGFPYSDEFGIEADALGVYYIDNISFQWLDPMKDMYPLLTENFDVTPTNDGVSYWWGEWAKVANGTIELITLDYTTARFGSPLIANAKYLTFDVKLSEGGNADSFRLELGDGNTVNWTTLIENGHAVAIGTDFYTVTINLADYVTNLSGLQVLGFHINTGGVIIDNMVVSVDAIGYQMSIFNDAPIG